MIKRTIQIQYIKGRPDVLMTTFHVKGKNATYFSLYQKLAQPIREYSQQNDMMNP